MTLTTLDEIQMDAEGFLVDYRTWTPYLAELLAEKEGLALTDQHWKVIYFARDEFMKNGDAPTLRRITKESGVSTREMYALFPDGPAKKAARIAGLKKPTGCI